jgi:hypothetical protein
MVNFDVSLISVFNMLFLLFFYILQTLIAKDSKFRAKFKEVSKRWPSLRATAVVGMGVDFTLIPRAMQAEEDLVACINEFRNIETANSITARMTAV